MANLNRRAVLKATAMAGGGFLLGLYPAGAQPARPAGPPLSPADFISIAPDGIVSITARNQDMGQGAFNLLPMLVAEELDVDWNAVRIVRSGVGPKYGSQFTGGSSATPTNWEPMRQIGGAARSMLVAAAAQTWGVSTAECTTAAGRVSHAGSSRSLGYGELATRASALPVPAFSAVKLKDPKNYKIIGTSTIGAEVKDIVQGKAVFGIDVTMPGLLYAVLYKTPVMGGKVASANLDAVRAMKGVRHAFIMEARPLPSTYPNYLFEDPGIEAGVVIVADSTWAALAARRKLEVKWDASKWGTQSNQAQTARAEELSKQAPARTLRADGDAEAVLNSGSAKVVEGAYAFPFIAHVTMEPQNCTAHFKDGKVEVWSTSQFPQPGRALVARVLGIPEADVTLRMVRAGGGFGRRAYNDTLAEAAWISKTVGAPIQLVWTREDDVQHDYYRCGGFQYMKGAVDGNGKLVAWKDHFVGYGEGDAFAHDGGFSPAGFPSDYVPNYLVQSSVMPLGLKTGALRAPQSNSTAWVVQSFLDELAHAAGKDPVAFRLEMLQASQPEARGGRMDSTRMSNVIKLVAEKSGWGKRTLPKGTALGVAFHYSHRGYVAEVAEVSVSAAKKVKVNHVWVAADVGSHIVNPTAAISQVQGAVIDGIGEMMQEITMRNGAVVQSNFHQHPILRIAQAPVVDVHFLKSPDTPTGLGEPALPPILPAVCNAIFSATGERIRTLPFSKQGYSFA